MLRYWVATALYQEVKLLDRYVKDAAIAGDYYPYLMRIQVTLMPRRRDLPYDAYTDVAMFAGDFGDVQQDDVPHLIPLLVTDDLEAMVQSRSVDQIRQL